MKTNYNYNLIHFFKETVSKYGSSLGLESLDSKYTFKQIDELSDKVALNIIRTYNCLNEPIPVHLNKSCENVIVFIGILKSGNFYVPIDKSSPTDRKKSIIDQLGAKMIVCEQPIFEDSCKNLLLEDAFQEVDESIDSSRLAINTKPAYTIFTSGSTGLPKGVVISHQSVVDYIFWAQSIFNTGNKTIIGNQAPFYFDNSVLDIYQMMMLGAKLVVIPEEYYMFPSQLLDFLEEREINFIFWVPSALVSISKFNALENRRLACLKEIVFAGEVMPTKHLNYWRKNLAKQTNFTNLYGPTEITVDCTYYKVERDFEDDEVLPIGIQCENTEIILLDESKNIITKSNIQGEICVSGVGLALGYFGNTDKTEHSFIQTPQHNHYKDLIYRTGDYGYFNDLKELIFIGRIDNQIKFQGYRIELGEIETVIGSIKGVSDVCVVFDPHGERILCCYSGSEDSKNLRLAIRQSLPSYMVPRQLLRVDEMPLTQNGKKDRKQILNLMLNAKKHL